VSGSLSLTAMRMTITKSQHDFLPTVKSFNSIYDMLIEPGLKSMLTDVNQYNDPDGLESRTDDLSPVLHLGR
jgi:hypothetical protein